MIVVSDTTPIISLLKAGHLDLLQKLYGVVCIPEAVYQELTTNQVFADEVKGRQVARNMGLRITGTVGMIIAAYEESYLTQEEVLQIVDILQKSGRHISERLYQIILNRLEEQC